MFSHAAALLRLIHCKSKRNSIQYHSEQYMEAENNIYLHRHNWLHDSNYVKI